MAAVSLNRVEIDLAALRANFAAIAAVVGSEVKVMAVVKADGYGHGMVRTAQTLFAAGARTFGVAEVEEGVRLRQAGLTGDIVILLGPSPDSPDAINDLVQYRLTPVVFDPRALTALSACAVASQVRMGVHLKVDVGMGRLGVLPDEVIPLADMVDRLEGVYLAGLMSHLPMADQPTLPVNEAHLARFRQVLSRVGRQGRLPHVAHIANSAAVSHCPPSHFDMVRPGITLYGCDPAGATGLCCRATPSIGLQPVMTFKTAVLQVKMVPSGYGLSYGHTFVTKRPTRLAVLPVGYDDGYLRRLSNRAEVLIHGQRAPVCGRVCMNACMVDVTDLADEVRAGDEVVLMGRQGEAEITADEMAVWLDTINYEVLCLFGNRNRRVYLD